MVSVSAARLLQYLIRVGTSRLTRQIAWKAGIAVRIDATHVIESRFARQAELGGRPALCVRHQERVLVALAFPVADPVAGGLQLDIPPERVDGGHGPLQRKRIVEGDVDR